MNRKPQAGTEALKGHWIRGAAQRRCAPACARTEPQERGSASCTPASPTTGRREAMAGFSHAGAARLRRLAAALLVAVAASAFASQAQAQLWSSNMTVTDHSSDNSVGYGSSSAFAGSSMVTNTFTAGGTAYTVGTLANIASTNNMHIVLSPHPTAATVSDWTLHIGTIPLAFSSATRRSTLFEWTDSTNFATSTTPFTDGATIAARITKARSFNTPPRVLSALPDLPVAVVGTALSYQFLYYTFRDADRDALTYTATKRDGSALPAWLAFTPATRTFSGIPMAGDLGTVAVKVTAFDGNGGSISDVFDITVIAATAEAHCDATDRNEIWCSSMTVATQPGRLFTYYGYNAYSGYGSLSDDTFMYRGASVSVMGLAYNGTGSGNLRLVLGRDEHPDFSRNYRECVHSRLGGARFRLVVGNGSGGTKSYKVVPSQGAQIHFDLGATYGVSWASGDKVPVQLLQVSSGTVLDQARPVVTAARSTTSAYDSIDLSWTAVDTVCGSPTVGYEIEVSEDGASWQTLVRNTGSTALTYTHEDLPQGAKRHYRVQATAGPKGTDVGSGFSQPVRASTDILSCGSNFPDEIWCAELTVGESSTATGFILDNIGSLSPRQFGYGGTNYMVLGLTYGTLNGFMTINLTPTTGHSVFNNAGFALRAAGRSYALPATRHPLGGIIWQNAAHPGWDVGETTIVRLTGPASGGQVEIEPPTVTDTPAVSAAGDDSEWTPGETVEVTLTFSEAVEVNTTAGRPSIGIALDGTQAREATYLSGSGTEALVFGYTLVKDDGDRGIMAVTPNSLALGGGTIRSVATGADAVLEHNGTVVLGSAGRTPTGPTASFSSLPEHHGGNAFTFALGFSAEPEGLSYRTVRAGLLNVEGGAVTRAVRSTRGSNQGWRVTVAPSGADDVRIELPARACEEANAICIGGQALSRAVSATVAHSEEEVGVVPLTATFSSVPDEHDGSEAFELEFRLSEEPRGVSFRTVQNGLFTVTGGSITRAWRLTAGEHREWGLKITPSGFGAVKLVVNATTDCGQSPGVCTSDGRMLGGRLEARIAGPPTLSVADAEVDENSGATLDFEVTLNRALNETVTVGYGTADVSASAGADYTSTSGTLTFAAQETSKTVSVPVLDDGHDEGSETMTLRLSSPSPTRVKLADAEATGTINNHDPMPLAWMVRFGRTVGSQVVDALSTRLEGASGSHVTVAGINIVGAKGDEPVLTDDDPFGLPEWAKNAEREADGEALTADDILLRSAFHLSSGGDGTQGGGPAFTAWGRVATGGFEAEADSVTMDGDVTTGLIGFDAEWERALAGIMFSQSKGDGSYRLDPEHGNDAGTVESSLTGVYPYARVDLNRQVSAWALAGAGSGELTLHQEGGEPMPTDISMRMGAVGVKGQVLDGTGPSGVGLNVKSDAMWVGTKSEDTDELAPTEGDVTRLRLIVQGERVFEAGNGATFIPSAEVGLRHDGGDAETGTGVEVGAGLRYIAGAPHHRGPGAHARRARGVGLRGMGCERGDPRDAERIGPGPDAVHRSAVGPHGERHRAALVGARRGRAREGLGIRADRPARGRCGLRLRARTKPRGAHALRRRNARGWQEPNTAHRGAVAADARCGTGARSDPADK